ncbi:hypothetical protein [Paucibacter soli]|uniref:hypothetical protein n=1 Tax=Paucibacter soli TaxID=3133433 RepID=UPI00309A7CB1
MKHAMLHATLLCLALLGPARAQSTASEASALSAMLPVAVSVAAPVMLLSTGVVLSVVAVEATATGTVWVLQRASDGARISVRFASQALAGAALSVGTVLAVTVISSGYLLSAAGEAIAFIPNEIGASLLYNEKLTR